MCSRIGHEAIFIRRAMLKNFFFTQKLILFINHRLNWETHKPSNPFMNCTKNPTFLDSVEFCMLEAAKKIHSRNIVIYSASKPDFNFKIIQYPLNDISRGGLVYREWSLGICSVILPVCRSFSYSRGLLSVNHTFRWKHLPDTDLIYKIPSLKWSTRRKNISLPRPQEQLLGLRHPRPLDHPQGVQMELQTRRIQIVVWTEDTVSDFIGLSKFFSSTSIALRSILLC